MRAGELVQWDTPIPPPEAYETLANMQQRFKEATVYKVGDSYLEVIPIAFSTEYAYSDEETLNAAQPATLIRAYDELLPALAKLAPLG